RSEVKPVPAGFQQLPCLLPCLQGFSTPKLSCLCEHRSISTFVWPCYSSDVMVPNTTRIDHQRAFLSFLATLSRDIKIGLEGAPYTCEGHYFWGLNDILCGGLHQLSPVACAKSEALYRLMNLGKDSDDIKIGCHIYEELSTVFVLREQMCHGPGTAGLSHAIMLWESPTQ
ncbi:hypothetical protein BDM02DRAFT_3245013, partial [Thelephora ganbajun]